MSGKRKRERKSGIRVTDMCLLAMIGTLMYVFKMIMAGLPNIEPVSLMIVVLACSTGWRGLWSIYIYVALEYCTWGLNTWSISYLYVWALLYGAAWLLRKQKSAILMALAAALFGFAFGALCSIPYILISGWQSAVSWWIAGIPFDLAHGTGNFILVLLLFQPLYKVTKRLLHSSRMNVHK